MRRSVAATDIAGIPAFAVQAKNDKALAFYQSFDFIASPTAPMRLFKLLKEPLCYLPPPSQTMRSWRLSTLLMGLQRKSTRFWSASRWTQEPGELPLHEDNRVSISPQRRRLAKAWMQCQTTAKTKASLGESQKCGTGRATKELRQSPARCLIFQCGEKSRRL